MEITKVEAIPLWASFADAFGGEDKVPYELSHPAFGMRSTPLTGQGCVVVKIHTDSEIVGVGESIGRPAPSSTAFFIRDVLEPMLVGRDPLEIEVLWTEMSEQLSYAPMAVSGVDIALWDIRGKYLDQPVHRLLGGPFTTEVVSYASPVPYMESPDLSAHKAQEFLDQGFHSIKLKIGRGVETDLEHVAAVRSQIGSDIRLLVDCNGAYNRSDSIRLGLALEEYDVFWFEEPVDRRFVDDLAEIRRRVNLPIATGEMLDSVNGFRDLLDAGAADVLMPNITRCGGITGMRKIADAAALRNVMIAPHGVGAGIGIVAALHGVAAMSNFMIYEYNQLPNELRHTVLSDPIGFREGNLLVPEAAGLGISARDEALRQFAV